MRRTDVVTGHVGATGNLPRSARRCGALKTCVDENLRRNRRAWWILSGAGCDGNPRTGYGQYSRDSFSWDSHCCHYIVSRYSYCCCDGCTWDSHCRRFCHRNDLALSGYGNRRRHSISRYSYCCSDRLIGESHCCRYSDSSSFTLTRDCDGGRLGNRNDFTLARDGDGRSWQCRCLCLELGRSFTFTREGDSCRYSDCNDLTFAWDRDRCLRQSSRDGRESGGYCGLFFTRQGDSRWFCNNARDSDVDRFSGIGRRWRQRRPGRGQER